MSSIPCVLVTGAAGFIGAQVSQSLLARGYRVLGIDNLNAYYEQQLKADRLAAITAHAHFSFHQLDVADQSGLKALFAAERPSFVVHLAAQAGVRYSISNPHAYQESNLLGMLNVLECCRAYPVEHLLFASSSSVYGLNQKMPYAESDACDHQASLYAATKKSNEVMAHSYSHLYNIPVTGLRFFTVYGPWGRPDMAYWKFITAIMQDQEIDVYNNGEMQRDFTYIDDIVWGITHLLPHKPQAVAQQPGENLLAYQSSAPYAIYNIGKGRPDTLMDFIQAIEKCAGKKAKKKFLPMQAGDVYATWADCTRLQQAIGYQPQVDLEHGVARFVEWYFSYTGLKR